MTARSSTAAAVAPSLVVLFDVGVAAAVVDDAVQVDQPERVPGAVAGLRAVACDGVAGLAKARQLRHVDVQQRPRPRPLVAPERLPLAAPAA
jgi:hypothetical protein